MEHLKKLFDFHHVPYNDPCLGLFNLHRGKCYKIIAHIERRSASCRLILSGFSSMGMFLSPIVYPACFNRTNDRQFLPLCCQPLLRQLVKERWVTVQEIGDNAPHGVLIQPQVDRLRHDGYGHALRIDVDRNLPSSWRWGLLLWRLGRLWHALGVLNVQDTVRMAHLTLTVYGAAYYHVFARPACWCSAVLFTHGCDTP